MQTTMVKSKVDDAAQQQLIKDQARRIDELIAANNENVQRRRDAFRRIDELEVDAGLRRQKIVRQRRELARLNRRITFQDRVVTWVKECFGHKVARDQCERAHRFCEESLELVQACKIPKGDVLTLVDYVYGREEGEVGTEVGDVLNTLAALSNAHHLDMYNQGDMILDKCWSKIDKIRKKWENKPKFGPLPTQE